MSIKSGAPFKLQEGKGPAEGYAVIKHPGALRWVCTHCDVVSELKRGVYIIPYTQAMQFVRYADSCGHDVYVPGRMQKLMI